MLPELTQRQHESSNQLNLKIFAISAIKAFVVTTVVFIMLFIAIVWLLRGAQSSNPHSYEELGAALGAALGTFVFPVLTLIFWSRQQHTKIVRFQDKRVFLDRLNSEVAKMRLKETRRSETFLSFKQPFSKKELSVDLSKSDLATLSGMYLPVNTLRKRLTQ